MTTLSTNTTTSTFIGANKPKALRPIGIISYNTTTGQVKQCEVFSSFWEGREPSQVDCIKHLFGSGYGLIRLNTLKYSSLI